VESQGLVGGILGGKNKHPFNTSLCAGASHGGCRLTIRVRESSRDIIGIVIVITIIIITSLVLGGYMGRKTVQFVSAKICGTVTPDGVVHSQPLFPRIVVPHAPRSAHHGYAALRAYNRVKTLGF
jgi:hypothetical protein